MGTIQELIGKWVVSAAVAVTLALALVGCSAGLRPFADGTAPPLPATWPPATPAPSILATPGATALPPSAAPTVDPDAQTPRFTVFKKHMAQMYADMKPVFRKLQRRLKDNDVPGSITGVRAAREWLAGEQQWLAQNQPRDCYRGAHEAWSGTVAKWTEGFGILEAALQPVNPAEIERFMRVVEEGTTMLQDYMASAAPVVCGR